MNVPALSKRVDNLSMKLVDEPKEHIAIFDPSSFTDAEKLLFLRIEELKNQHGSPLPPDILKANKDLVCKASEILLKYSMGNFRIAILCFFGDPESQRDKNLFDLFLYNSLLDLIACLKEAHKQPQNEEEFLRLFDKYDFFSKLSRLASGTNLEMEKQESGLIKTENSEDTDNEHYDGV